MSSTQFTKGCDIYFAVHENGINDVMNRAMKFLPSFFNFTDVLSSSSSSACVQIGPDPTVAARGDPLLSRILPPASIYAPFVVPLQQSPLQLTPLSINLPNPLGYVLQLATMQVDFNPSNAIALPSSVPHPLPSQNLAIRAKVAAGMTCPSSQELSCFSLDLYAEFALKGASAQFLGMKMNALEIAGLKPDGLSDIIECYTEYLANQVFSWLSLQVNNLVSGPLPFNSLGGVVKELQVSPATVPNESNPAVEGDQLKLFMDVVSLQLNSVLGQSGTSQPGPSLKPPVSKALRSRTGTGPSDMTLAISSGTFGKIFNDVLSGGTIFEVPAPVPPVPMGQPFATQPWAQFGSSPIYVRYKVGASLAGGTVSLQNPASGQPNGSIKVNNLKILWNELKFQINIDLPKITVGAIHTNAVTIDVPGIGTVTLVPAVDFAGITLFGGADIQIPIDLSPLNLVSEASMSAEPVVYYGTGNPGIQNCPNRWQLYVVPQVPIFVWPVFSINLTNAITTGINQFFSNLFGQYPGPIVDAIKSALEAALTGVFSALSTIFSDLASVVESIVNMIVNDVPGIKSGLDQLLLNYFTSQAPIFEIPDPLVGPSPTSKNWGPNPLATVSLGGGGTLGPSTIILPLPLPYIGVTVNSNEMVMQGDIGP
jgi:hypothetical protein